MTVVDKISRIIRLIPIKSTLNASEVALKFNEYIYRSHGILSKIDSDVDPIFVSEMWKSLFKSIITKLALSSACDPQTDGPSEIARRNVEE